VTEGGRYEDCSGSHYQERTAAALARKGRGTRCGRALSRKAVNEDVSLVGVPSGEQRRRIRLFDAVAVVGAIPQVQRGAHKEETAKESRGVVDAVQQRLVRGCGVSAATAAGAVRRVGGDVWCEYDRDRASAAVVAVKGKAGPSTSAHIVYHVWGTCPHSSMGDAVQRQTQTDAEAEAEADADADGEIQSMAGEEVLLDAEEDAAGHHNILGPFCCAAPREISHSPRRLALTHPPSVWLCSPASEDVPRVASDGHRVARVSASQTRMLGEGAQCDSLASASSCCCSIIERHSLSTQAALAARRCVWCAVMAWFGEEWVLFLLARPMHARVGSCSLLRCGRRSRASRSARQQGSPTD
jgi:hypothetical protein